MEWSGEKENKEMQVWDKKCAGSYWKNILLSSCLMKHLGLSSPSSPVASLSPPTFPPRPEMQPFDPSRKAITYIRQPNCLKFNLRHSFVPQSRGGVQRDPAVSSKWAALKLKCWLLCRKKHGEIHDIQSEVSGLKSRSSNLRSLWMHHSLKHLCATNEEVQHAIDLP